MSDKQVNTSSGEAKRRSVFQSGRPDRITAAVKPKTGITDKVRPNVEASRLDNNNMHSPRANRIKGYDRTVGDNTSSRRRRVGAIPKRKTADNLSEILERQKSEHVSQPRPSRKANQLNSSANDDIGNAAELLSEIKSDSNKRPIFIAALFSVIWITLCIAVSLSAISGGLIETSAFSLTSMPVLFSMSAILFIPCFLSWGVAVFLWRARELHQISLSLAYTALHLTQPEDMAKESIATIGQAVRREVAAMGDGIDRAIDRATTLESKFRNEVGNIQGFYKNNENIFHKIITDLQAERELMISTSDDLEARLPTILDKLKESSFDFTNIVQSADKRFTALAKTADSRLSALGENIGENNRNLKAGLDEAISNVDRVSGKLNSTTKEMFGAAEKLSNVGNVTNSKLEKIGSNFKRQTVDLGHATQAILNANEEINKALQERHESLSSSAENLVNNAEQINSLLGSFADVIEQSFLNAEDRSKNMQGMLKTAAKESVDILQTEMGKIRKATSGETNKLVELLRESSFTATTALRDDIQSTIRGSQNEVENALTMLLKESQVMGDSLKQEAIAITQMMNQEISDIKNSAVGNAEESLALIRESHEKTITDIIGRIDQAGARLMHSTDGLNDISGRLDVEMENTRHILAEQVSKLPVEAKQALSEMQAYVNDQVTMLDTLSKMVGNFANAAARPGAAEMAHDGALAKPAYKVSPPSSVVRREPIRDSLHGSDYLAHRDVGRGNIGDENDRGYKSEQHNVRENAPMIEPQSQPHNREPQSQPHNREPQSQPHNREPQSQPHNREPQSQPHNHEPHNHESYNRADGRHMGGNTKNSDQFRTAKTGSRNTAGYDNRASSGSLRAAEQKQAQPKKNSQKPAHVNGKANKWQMPELLSRASNNKDLPEHLRPVQKQATDGRSMGANARHSGHELHRVESLNAISLDLAKALDHKAPEELWARYRNGERNVFTRRLYTMRGQRLFDEVGSKYQNDGNFRRDVDRYIGDFEELLTKIYEQDRDSMLIDTYLSSETGKIYLMLAHASGRLD